MENVKKSRKSLIPASGIAVTEDEFYEKVQDKENRPSTTFKQVTQEKQSDILPSITQTTSTVKSARPKKQKFIPPVPKPSTSTVIVSDQEDSQSVLYDSLGDDNEPCCVCNKLSPPNLRDQPQLRIVDWAQCDLCLHWCHLQFCVSDSKSSEDEKKQFKCPHCRPKKSKKKY